MTLIAHTTEPNGSIVTAEGEPIVSVDLAKIEWVFTPSEARRRRPYRPLLHETEPAGAEMVKAFSFTTI